MSQRCLRIITGKSLASSMGKKTMKRYSFAIAFLAMLMLVLFGQMECFHNHHDIGSHHHECCQCMLLLTAFAVVTAAAVSAGNMPVETYFVRFVPSYVCNFPDNSLHIPVQWYRSQLYCRPPPSSL